ncbi:MFS transporter, SP family, sugar:H+ symporter, partial [Galdieria sulphuraria]
MTFQMKSLMMKLGRLELQLKETKVSFFNSITLGNPKVFTWVLVAFASMGGLLSGLDQSLISGANLYMLADLHLDSGQVSLVDSLMPLGAVLGALILSPTNEALGRKLSIIVACLLYTLGAGLEAGAHSVGMMYAGRFILGMGLGLEGGTVPVYVAECVAKKFRGNLVSLYQFNIALGEVFGYVVAAIFVNVSGTWRWMLGSSLLFSTVLLVGMIFMPESPRYLMHKGREVESYSVWKRIRGVSDIDARREFIVMRHLVEQEQEEKKRR